MRESIVQKLQDRAKELWESDRPTDLIKMSLEAIDRMIAKTRRNDLSWVRGDQ